MYREPATTPRDILVSAFSGKLFGLERRTGKIRWELTLAHSQGVVDLHIGDTVILAVTTRMLAFIDYATGKLLREVQQTSDNLSIRPTALLDGEHIHVARDGEVSCYTLSGDHVWTQPFAGKGYGAVALGFPGNVRQTDVRD